MINKKKICDGCQQEKYIFKNVTIDGKRCRFCVNCAPKKEVVKKQKPIKKLSIKKKKKNIEYATLRKLRLAEYPTCQINTAGCTTAATEIHHSAYRTGENFLDTDTWFATCRNCHSFIHTNPTISREKGWLK